MIRIIIFLFRVACILFGHKFDFIVYYDARVLNGDEAAMENGKNKKRKAPEGRMKEKTPWEKVINTSSHNGIDFVAAAEPLSQVKRNRKLFFH